MILMELFDYMIIGMGVLLIVAGWLCYRFPNMINPYGSMSDERKALVDIEGLKRATAIILTIMGSLVIVADVLHVFNVIDVEVASWLFSGSILVMIIPIIIAMISRPPIKMHTNGSSTGKYSKGHFLLEDDEKCMLFVRHKMPPYIEIRTSDNLYYLNGATEGETMRLFEALKEKEVRK